MDGKNTGSVGATEATAPSARAHHAGDGGAEPGRGGAFRPSASWLRRNGCCAGKARRRCRGC
jgi:hypothetical protein